MKILLIHPNPLEDYHLERLIVESLRSLEHEVLTLRYREIEQGLLIEKIKALTQEVDFCLILKGEILTEEVYDHITCLSGLWYVDYPKDGILPEWLIRGCQRVDYVFTTAKGLIPKLEQYNTSVEWLVEGAHLPLLQPVEREKTKQLSFFGTLIAETNNGDKFGERSSFLKDLADRYDFHLYGPDSNRVFNEYAFKNHYEPVWNDKLAEAIAETKIVIGYNSTNQIPFYWSNRTYTTLACKGFLITPYVPGIEQVFENHKDLVWFNTLEECYQLIEYYLERPRQRVEIAESGYNKIVNLFATQTQLAKMISFIESKEKNFPKQRIAFITDEGFVGCKTSALHWGTLLKQQGFFVDQLILQEQVEAESIANYDWLFFAGYSGKYELLFKHLGRKVVIWHSTAFQAQLENEFNQIRKINELLEQQQVENVVCTDLGTTRLFKKGTYVPNFTILQPQASKSDLVIPDKINLCALGPSKNRKNLFTILIAFSYLSDQHVLHLNVSEDFFKQQIEGIFDTSRIINHTWLTESDYYNLINSCTAGFQISVAESYNYVVAEHWLLNTPIICSTSIPANPIKELIVTNHENSGELIEKLDIVKRASKEKREQWQNIFFKFNELRKNKARQQLIYEVLQRPLTCFNINKNKKRLSIVYHGRNDNYGGAFKKRLAWSLATVKKAFAAYDPEVIFVNWNILPGTPKLFDEPIFDTYAKGIKVYPISHLIHRDLAKKHNYDGVYLEWYAKNFGLRRAEGEFILQINSDNLILDDIPLDLCLSKDLTYVGNRTEVNPSILIKIPDFITKDDAERLKGRTLIADIDRPHYIGGSCGEFVLTHRDNWDTICGNVETAARYCIDNVTATHLREITIIKHFPYPVYHISHPSADGEWPGFEFPLGYSGKNWGLAHLEIKPELI